VSERFSFEVVDALDYDELRPEYAPDAVAWVAERCGLGPGSRVVDLAAGTGRLSGRFLQIGVDVIAVEPAANMRAVLEQRFPAVHTIVATAESMPIDDGTIDAVVVGNAFHHFERVAAMAEIHRVLHPGGALAVFWAWPAEEEQLRIPGMRPIHEALEETWAESAITAAHRSWAELPATVDGFDPFERREFPATHVLPAARLADLYTTFSDVVSMPAATRAWLLDRISELSRGLPETLHLPGRTVVDLCARR
jgi:SAM-dependent methyltransferase